MLQGMMWYNWKSPFASYLTTYRALWGCALLWWSQVSFSHGPWHFLLMKHPSLLEPLSRVMFRKVLKVN
jgi:hypothetical protein